MIKNFLDERNNCQPSKELVPNSNKKKAGSYRIAIRVTKFVQQHSELGFAYGESAFCNPNLPLPVLFMAARYYYEYIMKDGLSRWSQLPQARYLFNSPYHDAAPLTPDGSVKKILHHFAICGNRRCTCNLDDDFHNRQLHFLDCMSLLDEVDKKISTTQRSRVASAQISTKDS